MIIPTYPSIFHEKKYDNKALTRRINVAIESVKESIAVAFNATDLIILEIAKLKYACINFKTTAIPKIIKEIISYVALSPLTILTIELYISKSANATITMLTIRPLIYSIL